MYDFLSTRFSKTCYGILLLPFIIIPCAIDTAKAQEDTYAVLSQGNIIENQRYIEIGTYFSALKYAHEIPVPFGMSIRYKSFQIITDFELFYSILYNFNNRRWSPYIGYGGIDSLAVISFGLTFEVYTLDLHKPNKLVLFLEPDLTWFGFRDPYLFPELRAGIKFHLY